MDSAACTRASLSTHSFLRKLSDSRASEPKALLKANLFPSHHLWSWYQPAVTHIKHRLQQKSSLSQQSEGKLNQSIVCPFGPKRKGMIRLGILMPGPRVTVDTCGCMWVYMDMSRDSTHLHTTQVFWCSTVPIPPYNFSRCLYSFPFPNGCPGKSDLKGTM